MVQFKHNIGDKSISKEEKDSAEKYFLDYLGDNFRKEFEEKKGVVTVNYMEPLTSTKRYSFILGDDYDLGNFIIRVNEYKTKNK
jgi:hypothetical protein